MDEKEYIERDAALSAQNKSMNLNEIRERLKCLPAADVEPVRHGRWMINSDSYYPYCSECNAEPKNGVMSKYCPDCGAKMEGKGR